MVVEHKQEHIYRVVRALADILWVAVEMGDVHQASKDADAGSFSPAFRDPTFLGEIVDAWLKYWLCEGAIDPFSRLTSVIRNPESSNTNSSE